MPLYCGGLCEAVIMKPTSAASVLVRYASTGVGVTPILQVLTPHADSPETNAASIKGPVTLVSVATSAFFALEIDAVAMPTLQANSGVKNSLTIPRTPEVPNNLPILTPAVGIRFGRLKRFWGYIPAITS